MDDIPVSDKEKALWLAVLIQSTADLVGISLRKNKLRENKHVRSAREWFEAMAGMGGPPKPWGSYVE